MIAARWPKPLPSVTWTRTPWTTGVVVHCSGILGAHCTVLRRLRIIVSVAIDSEVLYLSVDTTAGYFGTNLAL